MKIITGSGIRLDLESILTHGARVVLTVLLAWIVYLLLRRAIRTTERATRERIQDATSRQRVTTLLLLLNSLVKYVIIFFATIMVLGELKIDARPVLAAAGVVGLAVGFGAQNLVRDVVSGFFIIVEGQYSVGDEVEINGVLGKIEEVGLRATKLREPSGQLRFFPNGGITSSSNYTGKRIAYTVSIPVPVEAEAISALVADALEDFDHEFQVFAAPPALGPVESLPTYARLLRATVYAIPGRHVIVEQKLAPRLTAALSRAGHSMPANSEVTVLVRLPGSDAQS